MSQNHNESLEVSRRTKTILGFIISRGMHGATRDEISLEFDKGVNCICWPVDRLIRARLIVQTNRFRATRYGKDAHILVARSVLMNAPASEARP